jgi:hypothetical protein
MKVYIAGPLSEGDVQANIVAALDAADAVLAAGHIPYVPHLSWYWHDYSPKDYEVWMALDFEWLEACDVVILLPGVSRGADREVRRAETLGIPVYTLSGWLARVRESQAEP